MTFHLDYEFHSIIERNKKNIDRINDLKQFIKDTKIEEQEKIVEEYLEYQGISQN